jgi:hypothetical protein
MRDNFLKVNIMEQASLLCQARMFMLVSFHKGILMVMDNTYGRQVIYIRDHGKKVLNMD